MAPFKRTKIQENNTPLKKVKAYQNTSIKKLPGSERVFNDLMAKNLTKRFRNDSIRSPEKSVDTTFDRLLKGKVYNEVVYKKFPEHKFNSESTFCSSYNSSKSNYSAEIRSLIDSQSVDRSVVISPISTRTRQRKNRKLSSLFLRESCTTSNEETNESTMENNCHKISDFSNDLRLRVVLPRIPLEQYKKTSLQHSDIHAFQVNDVSEKDIFMEGLHLSPCPSNVCHAKHRSRHYDSISSDKLAKVTTLNEIYEENGEKENICEESSEIRITAKELSEKRDLSLKTNQFLRKSLRHRKPFIYNKFRKKPPFSSTPIRIPESVPSIVENNSLVPEISPLKRSYNEINLWNVKCPSPNSFITRKSLGISRRSKNIRKSLSFSEEKSKDPKLIMKTAVVLDKLSISEKTVNVKEISISKKTHNRRGKEGNEKIPRRYFTKRKKKDISLSKKKPIMEELNNTLMQKQMCLQQNPKVILTQLDPVWINKDSIVDFIDLLSSEDENSDPTSSKLNDVSSIERSFPELQVETGAEVKECRVVLNRIDEFLGVFQTNDNSKSPRNETNFIYLNEIDLNDVSDKDTDEVVHVQPEVQVKQDRTCSSDEDADFIECSVVIGPRRDGLINLVPGKNFRRSMALFKYSKIFSIIKRRRASVKMVPSVTGRAKSNDLRSFVLNKSADLSSVINLDDSEDAYRPDQSRITAKDVVLKKCAQEDILSFETSYPRSVLERCEKIGEGVFGEVFMMRGETVEENSVMKIIPIEGDVMVNLERQKTFEEILSEIVITTELSNLRLKGTDSFVRVKNVRCVRGSYPEKLLELWRSYDEKKSSENDSPEMFGNDQKFIILELSDAGTDLEKFEFRSALQALSVFKQVACGLAVAEKELKFEHRDLHWGNVLIKKTEKINSIFTLDEREIEVTNEGVTATIIDFTLSRIEHEGVVIFNDLAEDDDLFGADGDYQFEVYRLMKERNGNKWQSFEPYTNVLWLHYLLDKAVCGFRYKTTKSMSHKNCLSKLRSLKNKILNFDSAGDFVLNNFMY